MSEPGENTDISSEEENLKNEMRLQRSLQVYISGAYDGTESAPSTASGELSPASISLSFLATHNPRASTLAKMRSVTRGD